jgi:uncharacterized protein (DUF1810 family)
MIDWYGSKAAPRLARPKLPADDSLDRFHRAQATLGRFDKAYREVQLGRKQTHWMWFVFPQLRALAKSETARYFGIADITEARAYLADPVLAARLAKCTMAVLSHKHLMFGHPDNHKLRASMTLFSKVVADPTLPTAVLEKFYGGKPDQLTLDVLDGKRITLPPSRFHQTAMGRVEWKQAPMWEDTAPEDDDPAPDRPMDRAEVARFVRGFNVSKTVAMQIVDKWMEDQERARDAGWEAHADSVWYDEG